ncbi:MAG: MATE family efflux transporter [Roseibium sp.]|nr:MATE family efflux transporter [Roseibium sp.]
MSQDKARPNMFTAGPLGLTLVKTALPIIFVMSMNGLLTVVDAMFIGIFIGPDALSAVTLMFPAYMLLVATATLVSSGMSSLLARHLGGGRTEAARAVFSGAHGLALLAGGLLTSALFLFGWELTLIAADGDASIARMSYTYISITIWCSPLLFVLAVNSDALRSEGRIALMAGTSVFVSLANIVFNYVLIAIFELGVAGTAYGTALAQMIALAVIIFYRLRARTALGPGNLLRFPLNSDWTSILALGAPQSLSFLGIAIGSASTFAVLQRFGGTGYEATVAAFGIITRIMTFVYLPLLGLTHALQAMIGNNFGAQLWQRSDNTLRLGLATSLAYCAAAQVILTIFARPIGLLFVEDETVAEEVARILPIMVALLFSAGPVFVIATYFQAIGDALRAAILSLVRPYLIFLPALWVLPVYMGEVGIWWAGPVADFLVVVLTIAVLAQTARRNTARWGLFRAVPT